MAIVPFEENTNSIDGPEFIRKKLHEKLKRGGYAVQDIEKADALFQAHGLSDGGQLPVFKREGLAVWTKSPHLLFGDIETFDEVNVGIYLKREIHALIHIWDATTKTDMYSCDKTVSTQSMAKNKNAVISQFVSGLAETWVEHASHKPMAPEVLQFVEARPLFVPLRP